MSGHRIARWAAVRPGLAAVVLGALAISAAAACTGPAPATPVGPAPATPAGPVVATVDGAVRGVTAGAVEEFLGIPYAAPPVGPLRWRAPRPAAPWQGIRDAARFAPHCPQPGSAFGVASMSENCLYLNVFTPAGIQRRGSGGLPVMVWIHGGSLTVGESNDYDPGGLVGDGIIVVTINYRLGALGFLAHPALSAVPGGPAGDYGLMDQQAALRWVQANISGFGGDPRNVTIFGQSAGGLSVLEQLVSPAARGLFSRAIVESGTYDLTTEPLADAEAAGVSFAAKAGCPSQTAACLRSLPVSAILKNQDSEYFPDIDGQVLPRSLQAALASGQFNRVPVIDGTNRDESRLTIAEAKLYRGLTVTAANYLAAITSYLGAGIPAAAIAAQYPLNAYPSPSLALAAVGTDHNFACPALAADDALSRYVPTYAYEFNDQNAPERYLPPVGFPYGAAHATEVQYLFGLRNTAFAGGLSPPQQELAAAMKRAWTSFAKRGVPSGSLWPRFESTGQQMLSLIPPQPQVETGFAAEHHCAFWTALLGFPAT